MPSCPAPCSPSCAPSCNPACCGASFPQPQTPIVLPVTFASPQTIPLQQSVCGNFPSCSPSCAPQCTPSCCNANAQQPIVIQTKPIIVNLPPAPPPPPPPMPQAPQFCGSPCPASCAPACSQSCCAPAPAPLPQLPQAPPQISTCPSGCSDYCAPACSQSCCDSTPDLSALAKSITASSASCEGDDCPMSWDKRVKIQPVKDDDKRNWIPREKLAKIEMLRKRSTSK